MPPKKAATIASVYSATAGLDASARDPSVVWMDLMVCPLPIAFPIRGDSDPDVEPSATSKRVPHHEASVIRVAAARPGPFSSTTPCVERPRWSRPPLPVARRSVSAHVAEDQA